MLASWSDTFDELVLDVGDSCAVMPEVANGHGKSRIDICADNAISLKER